MRDYEAFLQNIYYVTHLHFSLSVRRCVLCAHRCVCACLSQNVMTNNTVHHQVRNCNA